MEKKINIAIVGVGRWGKNLLKEFNEQANVVFVCSKGTDDSIKFLQENYPKIKHTINLDDVLNDPSVEAVVVATPTSTHFEIAKKVLESNKHLFLEKPGTTKSKNLEILTKLATEKNLKFAVGYEFVHHPALKKIKELLKIEDMRAIFFEWNKWGTFEAPIIPHLVSHDIAIIKSLGINILNIKNYQKQKVISDADIIKIEFENDKNIDITSTINRVSVDKNKSITFIGKDNNYIWDNDNLFGVDIKNQIFSPIMIETGNSVSEEVKDFLESIYNGKNPLTNSKFALDIWETLNKIES